MVTRTIHVNVADYEGEDPMFMRKELMTFEDGKGAKGTLSMTSGGKIIVDFDGPQKRKFVVNLGAIVAGLLVEMERSAT